MSRRKQTASVVFIVLLSLPTCGRSQSPDIQGRAPLSLEEAIKASKDRNPEARAYAAYSAAQLGPGGAKAVPFLLHLLKNDSIDEVRAEAAQALGRIGQVEGVLPALRTALKHPNLRVNVSAAEAIGLLGLAHEKEGVDFLIATLKRYQDHSLGSPPEFVFEALVQLDSRAKRAGPTLLPFLRRCEPSVRFNVLKALSAIDYDGDDLVSAMIVVITDKNMPSYLAPIGETAELFALPLLTGRLDDSAGGLQECIDSFQGVAQVNQLCQQSAISVLGRIGPKAKAAVPVLTECLKDKNLQGEARKALESIRGVR
jgi:HEAT repeat protein